MADAENRKRGAKSLQGTDGNGQAGDNPAGAEPVITGPDGEELQRLVVVPYRDVSEAALAAERNEGQHGRRITRLFSKDPAAPELWNGTFGSALVDEGDPAYQFSDGEVVTL